ncbi:MAG: CbiX/SirB N-terminal domain-containing protein [Euryarchaeota archaeon]|nr:CbiX/SirB N-terminal domain-containing protein [Euryarchaeota archaeon]
MEDIRSKAIRRTLSTIVAITILVSLIAPVVSGAYESDGAAEKIGVLVVAHGSPSESWCSPVRNATDEMDLPYPVELGFLEFVPNETINLAVDGLDDAGVTKIIAVPLFISSHSSHIQEIEYVLGLRDALPLTTENVVVEGVEIERTVTHKGGQYIISRVALEADTDGDLQATGHPEDDPLVPVETDSEIVLTAAMDDHWLMAGIVADRTADLCADMECETLVLVAHGTGEEENFAGWVNSTSSLADQARLKLLYWRDPAVGLGGTKTAFIHHNETLHPEFTLEPIVKNATDPVVVPLMVSEGYFTCSKIPGLLENLTYAYDGSALTPHPDVAEWIEIVAAEEFTDLTLRIDDETGEPLDISLDDVGAAHGHVCPCVAAAFKASQTAFLAWDGVLARGDLEIVSAHPSDGHNETFEYILNSSEDVTVELPEGTDSVNLTVENYNYKFIEKSTGDVVVVSVNEELFQDGFFDMRKRCKTGVATPDEKSAFKLAKKELKEKILYLPAEEVFKVSGGGGALSPEELFKSLAGEWAFEGSMILGNDIIPINGTRTFTSTGPVSADFIVAYKMGETETAETGSAWWDGEREQLAIKEGDEIGYSNLTSNGYESRAVLKDGIPELNISVAVVSEESLTILDDITQVMKWSAVNMNGETLCSGKLTFKPVAHKTATTLTAEIIPAISMTVPTTTVDFGKVGAGMTSANQVITVVNTGASSAKVTAMMLDDAGCFYNESLRLNGGNIGGFSSVVPSDTSDFRYEYDVLTNLVVPDWAGGKYDGTILFVAESES